MQYAVVLWLATLFLLAVSKDETSSEAPSLLVVTVATEETDGLKRLIKSAHGNDVHMKVFGLGEIWRGGDTRIEQVKGYFEISLTLKSSKYSNIELVLKYRA